MSSEKWKSYKLGELCNSVSVTHKFDKEKLIFLNTGDIERGKFLHRNYSDVMSMPGQAKKTFRRNDILFSEIRPANGRYALVDFDSEDYLVSTKLMVIRAKEEILPKFLYFFLTSNEITSWLQHLAESRSGTFPQITFDQVKDLDINLPPLSEQEFISDFIFTLDEKIEINRRMNSTLESMAQTVFHQWFVENEEVGDWEVVSLPEIIEVNPSRTLKKGEIAPYLDMANMPTQGHRGVEWIDRTFGSGTKFINGDTLLARITPCLENGKTGFVDFLKDNQVGWGSTEYIVFHPKPPLPPEYGYYLARSEELRSHAIRNMTGTSGRQRTPASCFDSFMLTKPSDELARKFGEFAGSVIEKVRANDEESRTLGSLRDSLLPKLMRGEVRVKDVEKILYD